MMSCLALCLALVVAQTDADRPLPNAATEMRQASIDANDLEPGHWRYLSLYAADDYGRQGRMASYSLNSVSWSDFVRQPQEVLNDQGQRTYLLRINLEWYSTKETLPKLIAAWEKFYDTEPYFTVGVVEEVPYVRKINGKIVEHFFKTVTRRFPVHAGASEVLVRQCGTKVPIVRADWFVSQVMDNPDTYYSLGLLEDTVQKFAKQFGLDFDGVLGRPTTKIANIIKRAPTRKPGQLGFTYSPYGLFTYALDVDSDQDPKKDPFRNPHGFEFAGSEFVVIGPNNMPKYYIADAAGKRIAEVPNTVAPFDYSSPLNAVKAPVAVSKSCITCHNQKAMERCFKFFGNDQRMFFDATTRYEKDPHSLDELFARYDTSFVGKQMILAGFRVNEATKLACGYDSVQAARSLQEECNAYRDELVTLERAARELGVTPDQFKAAVQGYGAAQLAALKQDEPYIFGLANGLSCSRGAWELSYSFGFQMLYHGE